MPTSDNSVYAWKYAIKGMTQRYLKTDGGE